MPMTEQLDRLIELARRRPLTDIEKAQLARLTCKPPERDADRQQEALAVAADRLRQARAALSAAIEVETGTKRTITLARAYDEIGRTLNELADL